MRRFVWGFGSADLRLNGIKLLTPGTAGALAAHKGKVLRFGLEKIDSLPLARKLARQWRELRLGLIELSTEVAGEVAKHRGSLHLTGLAEPSPQVQAALTAHPNLLSPRPKAFSTGR